MSVKWKIPQVYEASYWYQYSDSISSVIGFEADEVETAIDQDIEETIRLNCFCYPDECRCEMRWSGIVQESLLSVLRPMNKWERRDVIDGLREFGIARV